jgi:hypothetical protein
VETVYLKRGNFMRKSALLIFYFLFCFTVNGQYAITENVEIITIFSQNREYFLTSIPYDDIIPSIRGKTSVYKKGDDVPLYVIERSFDLANNHFIDDYKGKYSRYLYLSDDGQTIFYLMPHDEDEEIGSLKDITIYKQGKLYKSYAETEITGCDKNKEDCTLVYSRDYSKYSEVVDIGKSKAKKKKVYKDGMDEKDKFLNNFSIFCSNDIVYLIDSKKNVHLFDLEKGDYVKSVSFDKIYQEIKGKAENNKYESKEYEAPMKSYFPKLKSGKDTYESLADYIGMKHVAEESYYEEDLKFRLYSVVIGSIISRDGSLEIESIDIDNTLPKDKIAEFFKNNKFDSSFIPNIFDKWYLGENFFYFRNKNDTEACKEKQQKIIQDQQEYQRNVTLATIDNIYIPKDLCECFIEIDKLLSYKDKEEIKKLLKKEDIMQYHLSLGMSIRNMWGLWSGSRLQKYFIDKGIYDPDEMSGEIIYGYYDWLKGNKNDCTQTGK